MLNTQCIELFTLILENLYIHICILQCKIFMFNCCKCFCEYLAFSYLPNFLNLFDWKFIKFHNFMLMVYCSYLVRIWKFYIFYFLAQTLYFILLRFFFMIWKNIESIKFIPVFCVCVFMQKWNIDISRMQGRRIQT